MLVAVLGASLRSSSFFVFDDTATTEIYTLSLHDALPIYAHRLGAHRADGHARPYAGPRRFGHRSEEHTSELQSRGHLVWRLLLEQKKAERYSLPMLCGVSVRVPLHDGAAVG